MEKTVYFRAFEDEDALLIHQWRNDDELHKYDVGLNKKTCLEEDTEWVKARKYHNPYETWWAICSIAENKIIGWACLTNIHYINSSANFGGIVIGDKKYQDGFAWIETYIYVLNYAFERLHLNRLYGTYIEGHPSTTIMADVAFFQTEGVLRQSIYKNGRFHDEITAALLSLDYFEHKAKGDYEFKSMMKRLITGKKNSIKKDNNE